MADDQDGQGVYVRGKKLQGELGEGLQVPNESVVEDRLDMIGFLSFCRIQVHIVNDSHWV